MSLDISLVEWDGREQTSERVGSGTCTSDSAPRAGELYPMQRLY